MEEYRLCPAKSSSLPIPENATGTCEEASFARFQDDIEFGSAIGSSRYQQILIKSFINNFGVNAVVCCLISRTFENALAALKSSWFRDPNEREKLSMF